MGVVPMDLQEERSSATRRPATVKENRTPNEKIPLAGLDKCGGIVGLVDFVLLNIIITNQILIGVP